jgi:diguanylate cyclase (GGDEF)-like protein/PAS domain S-box-containing protein
MNSKAKRTETLVASALALAVLSIGMVITYLVYDEHADQHRKKLDDDFHQSARQYAAQAQRQLDVYAATNHSLAAYLGTSADIDRNSFSAFIHAAHYFSRLKGTLSFGYLPRVAPRAAAAFVRHARAEFPDYAIQGARAGADFYYPLLYGEHVSDAGRLAALRGFDFSSIPDRLDAIRTAEAGNAPAASHVHQPIDKPGGAPILLTFTPVRRLQGATGSGTRDGVVFSVMDVAGLFEGIDNGAMANSFDIEVGQLVAGTNSVVYRSDDFSRASYPAVARQYAHVGELRYADKAWTLHVVARPGYLAARADRTGWMLFAIGALLSLIAAYATSRTMRRYVARHTSSELSERFEAFFETHPFAVYAMDRERRLVFVNQKMTQELGMARDDLLGVPAERFIVAENKQLAAARFRDALSGNAVAYQNLIVNAQGQVSDVAIVLIPIVTGGIVTRVLGFAENITERKRAEKELYESRQMLQLILDTIPERVFWKNLDSAYLGANRQLIEEAGLEHVGQLVGKTDGDLPWSEFAERYRAEDLRVLQSGTAEFNVQQRLERPDGSVSWFEVDKVPLNDSSGAVVGLLGVARDITEHKRMEAELVRRAHYDSLTGLPNRALFYSELQQAIKRAPRRQGVLALLYFDIDRFKLINDTFGHDVGDVVICTFGARVRGVLRESDFVARLGGDEFVLIAEDLASRADAAAVAEKLLSAMRTPFAVGDRTHEVSTSIGIAFLDKGMSVEELIKAADEAMYEAKRSGRNCFRGAVRMAGD